MEVSVNRDGRVTVIAVEGSIDAFTADDFLKSMQAQVAAGDIQLVADLSEVDYASSAGLSAILVALKQSREGGGDLRLAAVQKGVYRVLELSGFNSLLKIYDDVESAVASYGRA